MAIGVGGLNNSSSLFAQNALRLNNLMLSKTSAQLSSGNRLVSAAIDPSGIGMSANFRAQVGGISTAIQNTQDAIGLTRTAGSTLNSQMDSLIDMRNTAIRSANDATMTSADQAKLDAQFQAQNTELTRSGEASTFNTKQLTSAVNPYGTQQVQSTPDNNPAANNAVTINPSTAATLGTSDDTVSTTAGAQTAISEVDKAIQNVSNQQASLGVQERVMQYRINDLEAQKIASAEANSRIADTDFAKAASDYNKGLLLNKVGISMLAKANMQGAGLVGKLLGF
ncbi:MAG TPA: flagellin [bacterium]|nr:flagellin [bacterium]